MMRGSVIARGILLAALAGPMLHGTGQAQSGSSDPEAEVDEASLGVGGDSAPHAPLAIAADGRIVLPSGQVVTLVETLDHAAGPDGPALRFRFLAPAIARNGGTIPAEVAQDDMLALCEGYALPRLTEPLPSQIIISLSDRPVPFGETDPDATQFFDSFRPENGRCIPEAF